MEKNVKKDKTTNSKKKVEEKEGLTNILKANDTNKIEKLIQKTQKTFL